MKLISFFFVYSHIELTKTNTMRKQIEKLGFIVEVTLGGWITAFSSETGTLKADSWGGLLNLCKASIK